MSHGATRGPEIWTPSMVTGRWAPGGYDNNTDSGHLKDKFRNAWVNVCITYAIFAIFSRGFWHVWLTAFTGQLRMDKAVWQMSLCFQIQGELQRMFSKNTKRKEARAHVKGNWTHMIITEKNTTREHISKRHMNTQQRENTSKRHENTPKGKHNWKNFVFHFHWFSYMWGFRAKPRSRAHVICTNRRRKKEIGHAW